MSRPYVIIYLLVSFLFILIYNRGYTQHINEQNFTLYTNEQGLSRNFITGLAQDSTGYLWIATASGLNRFNGCSFAQFHSTAENPSLPQDNLAGLEWLDSFRLASYTSSGLHIMNTRTLEQHSLHIPYFDKQYQFKFNKIKSLTSQSNGDIFILTTSGFYHFNKNYELVFRFDRYKREAINIENFAFGWKLFWIDLKRLAILSIDGLYLYDIEKKRLHKYKSEDNPILIPYVKLSRDNSQFFQTKPGILFILDFNSNKLVWLNFKTGKIITDSISSPSFRKEFDYRSQLFAMSDSLFYLTGNISGFYPIHLDHKKGTIRIAPNKIFPGFFCTYLLKDRADKLWIGTNRGLLKEDNRLTNTRRISIPPQIQTRFPNIAIMDIYISPKYIYAATKGNAAILVFDKQNFDFIRVISLAKFVRKPQSIYKLVALNDSNLLAATSGPLCRINLKTNQISELHLEKFVRDKDWIADLYKDHQGNIWITAGGNLYKCDRLTHRISLIRPTGIPADKVVWLNKIQEDTSGNIWLTGHGVVRYNIKSNKIDRLIESFPYIKIPDKQVNSFISDSRNNLWINTNNNGVACYNINTRKFRHFTKEDGLPDNNIASMIIIGSKLWIASFSGIACLDLTTHKISSFGREDGFPDEPIENGACFSFDSSSQNLYIGFINKIVAFHPEIAFHKMPDPNIFIENIKAEDGKKIVYPGNHFKTSWKFNSIIVSIGSINFFGSSSQRFAYRVAKNDSNHWQQLGTQNTFNLSNLTPGTHHVQVKIFSINNQWHEQIKEMEITITPPFWRESWFIVLFILACLVLTLVLIQWKIATVRKKEYAKTHLQELKAEEYRNQFELEHISNYFSSSLAHKKDVDEILWDVAQKLIGKMNYVDCMIYLWNSDKTKMVQKASYGPKGDPIAINSNIFDVLPGQGIVGHVMETREPILVPDTRKDPRYRVDDIPRLSEICVPIIHNNELIGIIDSEHPEVNHFKERDIQILTTIATLVSNKIKQLESEQFLEAKKREIAFINQQLAEAQLSALQTQMNPHFIFNSLNSIKRMILANEQQNASRYLSKFAQMIRITLNQSKETFTTLQENVEYLETYLIMEKLRFDDSFNFKITIGEDIDKDETLMPTMMIQPLAENAIWHGLMNKEGEKKLRIHFSRRSETIYCTIEDNGIGIRYSQELKKQKRLEHHSVGLSNLRNRINILNEKYNTQCQLDIIDLNELDIQSTGTCVILRFNIINNKPLIYESNTC